MEVLDECEVLKNQKGEPLMVAGGGGGAPTPGGESSQVLLKFQGDEVCVSLK